MNKKTKLLSIFILAGVISSGVAVGVTGCKKHSHNWSDTYTVQENGKHAKTCDGCDKLLDEHDGEWTNDQDTSCDHDGCTVTRTVTPSTPPASTDYVVDAAVTALKIEGVTAETINLNSTDKKSHTIDKSAIKVYFMKGTTKDVEVPAANLTLTLLDPSNSPLTSWENLKTDGSYTINAKLKNAKMADGATVAVDDVVDSVIVTVVNKVTGLELKEGAKLTQKKGQPATTMTSTWNFQKVYQNGEKVDLTASDVEIGTIDTSNVGTGKTVTVTLKGTTITTTVTYDIEANDQIHVVSNAYVFGAADVGAVTPGQEFKQGETTVFKINTKSSNITENPAEYVNGTVHKKFYYRYTFGGGSFAAANNNPNSDNNRYWDVTTAGAATITVYFASGGGASTGANWNGQDRGVAIFGGEWGAYDTMTLIGKKLVPNDNEVYALTVDVTAAGTYHIATANDKDIRLYGVQVDTTIEQPGNDVLLPTATVPKEFKLTINDTEDDGTTKKTLKVGQPFSTFLGWIAGGTVVEWNPVTADITETPGTQDQLARATFKIKGVDILPNDTITTDMLGTDVEITITIDGLSTTHRVTVETAIAGVTGITAGLTDAAKEELQVDTDESKFNLTKDKIEVKIAGANASDASISILSGSLHIYYNDQDITDTGYEFAIGADYEITVKAKVTNGTAETDELEYTFKFSVTKKPAAGAIVKSVVTFDCFDLSDLGEGVTQKAYSEETTLTGFTGTSVTAASIVASSSKSVNIKKKAGTTVTSDITVDSCFGTNGGVKNNQCSVKLTLAAGTYTVTIYSKQTATDRKCQIINVSGTTVDADTVNGASDGTLSTSDMNVSVFNNVAGGGTIYVGGNNNIDIYSIEIAPVEGSGDSNPGGGVTVTESTLAFDGFDLSDLGEGVTQKAYSEETTLTGFTGTSVTAASIVASSSKSVNIKKKAGTTVTTGVTVDSCFGTNGGVKNNQCSVKVTLAAGTYTITMYSKQTAADRKCQIINVSGTTVDASTVNGTSDGTLSTSDMNVSVFNNVAGGGTIYLGGNNNIDIYYIVITPVTAS